MDRYDGVTVTVTVTGPKNDKSAKAALTQAKILVPSQFYDWMNRTRDFPFLEKELLLEKISKRSLTWLNFSFLWLPKFNV